MSSVPKGLGRGIDAIIQQRNAASSFDDERSMLYVPISNLVPNPDQPRKHIAEEGINELAQSIKSQGLLQPLLVRQGKEEGNYEIIAGERRWLAAQKAGLHEVPAILSSLNDEEALIVGLIENLQREDLNPMEEAQALDKLHKSIQLTQADLAKKVGRSRSAISNSLRLLNLHPDIQEALRMNIISSGHARAILSIDDQVAQRDLFFYLKNNEMTVRQLEGVAQYWRKHNKLPDYIYGSVKHPKASGKTDKVFVEFLQNKLNFKFSQKVKVHGREEQGKISFSYKSNAELKDLLEKLGVDVSDVSRETTTKSNDKNTNG